MLDQIAQEFIDIGYYIKKKDNFGDTMANELKDEFENNINVLSDPKALNEDKLNELARIDTLLTCEAEFHGAVIFIRIHSLTGIFFGLVLH
ncbi:hypothetical protein SUGI_1033250 [Cryptomeria japonica]|nr:hypothetical protein SUGI_1033250 [Cryptomeria japonica]